LLGAFYGIGLSLVGLQFGLVIGFGTGLVSFVPYFGMLIGFVVGMVLAIVQFDTILPIAMVAAVFGVGQVIEGNFLTPKLVGDRVNLHAVWIIFALLAGGALFGFVGVLLAIPIAAVIGVLVRFSLSRYLDSTLYRGARNPASPSTDDSE
ncbi:MAG: AI-2E family transporter, partial [Alphaproteobacteria bacterium]|nr:AI-2E family transporter [Alphaproteobacteria bacterium]